MNDETVGKIWGEIRELRAWIEGELKILYGNHDGTREESRELRIALVLLKEKLLHLEQWGKDTVNDLWHVKRPAECLGKEALEDYKREVEKQMADVVEKANMVSDIMKAIADSKKQITVALIGFAGVLVTVAAGIIVALITKGG